MEESLNLEFAVDDRVRLSPAAIAFYGGTPQWIPEGQGGGTAGTVIFAGDRPHDPRAAARPYMVRWDNGVTNSYRVGDLVADAAAEEAPEADNIVAFRPRGSRPS